MARQQVRQQALRGRKRVSAESGAVAAEVVLNAAVEMFAAQGFHGTSMRDIAARAGTSVSHAYYYFPSKTHILVGIMTRVTEDLIAALLAARGSTVDKPAMRLAAIVRAHVRFHIERQAESFVGNSELRSLGPEDRARVVALRDRVSRIFKEVIATGFATGVFRGVHQPEATRAIISMCTAVAGWYRPNGPDRPETIENRYADLALQILGYRHDD